MSRDFITIVSGLPRSGTSLMMQMLSAGGLPVLTDKLRQPDESNPRGYFEFDPVKRLRSDRSWLEQAQGKVVKIIHLLLRELPTDAHFEYRVVLMQRSLDEVIASQTTMLRRQGKPGADPAMLRMVFEAQLSDVARWLASHDCFKVLTVEHRELIGHPEDVSARINDFLSGGLDLNAMSAAVDPQLYRERR